jgi:hypothetical protein
MKRTTKTQQQPTREAAIEGIKRTVKWLQVQYGADPEDPFIIPGNIKLQEPIFKGWVVALPHKKEQYIACFHHLDTIFKLTPAGNILLCPDNIIKSIASCICVLIKERGHAV